MRSRKRVRPAVLLAATTLAAACDGQGPASPPGPRPSEAPPPAATPAPTPSPVLPPAPPGNQPPTASISGGGSCHPRNANGSIVLCEVTFTATARDPDGDRLSYSWTGCATGDGDTARCRIDRPGVFEATVVVTDGRGGHAAASATAEGTNRSPNPALLNCFAYCCSGGGCSCDPGLPAGQSATCWWDGSNDLDPDGDGWSCGRVFVQGACTGGGVGACGGAGDAIEVDFRTGQGGACTVSVVVRDTWGAERTVSTTVQVRAP